MSGYSSYYSSSYPMTSSEIATVGTAIAGIMLFVSLIALVIGIIQIIAMWKIFTKAGEKGWKSIIPIYNFVILFKISGLSPWLILVYLAAIIPFIGWIAPTAIAALLSYKLAISFGKDGGWAVGLYFLPSIFYMILGFGKSEYVGPNGEQSVFETNTSTEDTENK